MPVVGERWEIYASEEEDGRRVVTFDLDLAENPSLRFASSSHRVLLRFPAQWVRPNGMPGPEAAVPMRLAEHALVDSLETQAVGCRLVGRTTYAGHRELTFQVVDEPSFATVLAAWRAKQSWETRVEHHPGWEYFEEGILPTPEEWDQIGNRRVIDGLVEAGTDTAQPHALEHVFLGGSEALSSIATRLTAEGYRVVGQAADTLTLSKEALLNEFAITGTTLALKALAAECRATYDGWGAAVIPVERCPE